MPSWGELLQELQPHTSDAGETIPGLSFDELRTKYISLLSQKTGRNVIAYYSGWLKPGKTQNIDINDSDLTGFMNAMRGLDTSKGLDLILHTPGGNPTATEGIVKYLHNKFNNDIRVIVPQMAMSAGTMLACASKTIILGKYFTKQEAVKKRKIVNELIKKGEYEKIMEIPYDKLIKD